jgi:vacuolar protein sorting-associated protein 52
VESLILRLASSFPARKDQLLFLINNYDVVMSIIIERTRDDSKESETFREQLKARSEEFVEQVLQAHFGYLLTWLKEIERNVEKGIVLKICLEKKYVPV